MVERAAMREDGDGYLSVFPSHFVELIKLTRKTCTVIFFPSTSKILGSIVNLIAPCVVKEPPPFSWYSIEYSLVVWLLIRKRSRSFTLR